MLKVWGVPDGAVALAVAEKTVAIKPVAVFGCNLVSSKPSTGAAGASESAINAIS